MDSTNCTAMLEPTKQCAQSPRGPSTEFAVRARKKNGDSTSCTAPFALTQLLAAETESLDGIWDAVQGGRAWTVLGCTAMLEPTQ